MSGSAAPKRATTIDNDPAKPKDAVDTAPATPLAYSTTGVFLMGASPQSKGTPYSSAGGGEVFSETSLPAFVRDTVNFFREEASRPNDGYTMVVGPDTHARPPQWMENKNVAIDGSPLTDADLRSMKGHWTNRYRKELEVGEAIAEVKKQKRVEMKNNAYASANWLGRKLGIYPPLDEEQAQRGVRMRHKIEEEAQRVMNELDEASPAAVAGGGASQPSASAKRDLLLDSEALDMAEEDRRKRTLGTAWKVLMESVETGRPLAKVAQEYRPRVDFYGIDPFLDSAPSLIWFSTKCGVAIGLFQGTVRALQAVNVDVQFLKASGVGVLSILNMSVFASVVKWGGNTAIFATAFCVGDRLARTVKRRMLPPHDAEQRSTANYVVGLAFSGGTVGILPWWMLNDATLAARLAVSGMFVGGTLGLVVGFTMQRLIALNVSRLDATNRQLRRYEALMKREREWVEMEREKHRVLNAVWW